MSKSIIEDTKKLETLQILDVYNQNNSLDTTNFAKRIKPYHSDLDG